MKTLEAKIIDSTHLELIEPIPLRPGLRVEVVIRLEENSGIVEDVEEPERQQAAVHHKPDPGLSGPRRQRELEWRRKHRDLLQAFAGQWVVLEGEEIVAHGNSIAVLVEQARSQGIQVPYVFYVEESRPDVVSIGL